MSPAENPHNMDSLGRIFKIHVVPCIFQLSQKKLVSLHSIPNHGFPVQVDVTTRLEPKKSECSPHCGPFRHMATAASLFLEPIDLSCHWANRDPGKLKKHLIFEPQYLEDVSVKS